MKILSQRLLIGGVTAFVSSFFIFTQVFSENADLIINEIGATASTSHEWIEVWNKGTSTIDIVGWKFLETSGTSTLLHVINTTSSTTSTLIKPTEFAVVAQNSEQFLKDYPGSNFKIFDSIWGALNEQGEEIGFQDAAGKIVEKFVYVSSSNFSLERINPFERDYTTNNWREHAVSNTVGFVNSVFSTSTTSTPTISMTSTIDWWSYIKINEIVANPETGDEWVELYNQSTSSINLVGGVLCDNRGGSCVVATTTGIIAPKGWVVVDIVGNKLNNTGDAVVLKNSSSTIVDQVIYTGSLVPQEGQALARRIDGVDSDDNSDWAITTNLTPGTSNIISNPPPLSGSSGGVIAPPPTNTVSNQETSVIYSSAPKKVVLYELYPNPPGVDNEEEFIELKNNSQETISLEGWKLGSTSRKFNLSGELEGQEIFVWPRAETGIALKNSASETIRLYDNHNSVVDEIAYDKALEGYSYSRDESGIFKWTRHITKGATNKFVEESRFSTTTTSTEIKTTPSSTSTDFFPTEKINTNTIEISEVFSDPQGVDGDEFVELHNYGFETVDLRGWGLRTKNGKEFVISTTTIIYPNEYRPFYKISTKLTLHNTEEFVELVDSEQRIISSLSVSKSISGKSYSLIQGQWFWVLPNPGMLAAPPPEIVQNVERPKIKSTNSSKKIAQPLSLLEARQIEAGSLVKLKGVVTVVPGIFGSQYFYISDEEGGVQIYQNKKEFPELKIGQYVEVVGTVSAVNTIKRVNVKSAKDIGIMHPTSTLVIEESDIQNLSGDNFGTLVQVEGFITEIKTNFMYIDDGQAEVQVYFKKGAAIDKNKFKEGDKVKVVGVVENSSAGIQLWPRSPSDIIIITPAAPNLQPTTNEFEKKITTKKDKKYLEATVGGVGVVTLGWLMRARGMAMFTTLVVGTKKVREVFKKSGK